MPSGFRLITGPPAITTSHMNRLLVRLAVQSPIRWLICGGYLDLQRIIYAVVERAKGRYYDVLENNIAISRAETCYQVVALLGKTKASKAPIFVSDMLLHFYEPAVRDAEATELLIESVQALTQLCQGGPVIVSATGSTERAQFHALLLQKAGRITYCGGGSWHGP